MPWWLVIVIFAYALNALAAVVDKILLAKAVKNPAVYAFYIASLGMFGWALAPFGARIPSVGEFLLDVSAGIVFTIALLFLFYGLRRGESSRVTPFVGALSPVFVWIFSYALLPERLNARGMWAMVLLVIGSLILVKHSHARGSADMAKGVKVSCTGWLFFAVLSAMFFGFSYTLTKYNFNHQPFISAFVWMRLGAFVGALFLFASARNRTDILHPPRSAERKMGWFLFGQASGAASFILVNYAISLANVSLVNALQGIQYVFLLIMVWLISFFKPALIRETMRGRALVQKIAAIGVIGVGFALLI